MQTTFDQPSWFRVHAKINRKDSSKQIFFVDCISFWMHDNAFAQAVGAEQALLL
jgi:hypothetical protein